jgi:hypothetical protein
MKWYADKDEMREALKGLYAVKSDDLLDSWDVDEWFTAIVRVEARDGAVTMVGPWGSARVAAEIEEPGVLFCEIRHFVDVTHKTFDGEPNVEFTATHERVTSRWLSLLCEPWQWGLFDDPAGAPETWEPEPEDEWAGALDEESAEPAEGADTE